MQKPSFVLRTWSIVITLLVLLTYACSKGGDSGGQTDPCEGVSVAVTASITDADAGGSNGSLAVNATGGSGFTFKLNAGNFQSSATFNNLAKGSYTITAKNSNGCTGSRIFQVNEKASCTGTPGPKFNDVKALVQTKCAIATCHTGPTPAGTLDMSVDCNIVLNKSNINSRAVVIGDMPQTGGPLSASEKQKITDWLNAGGKITD